MMTILDACASQPPHPAAATFSPLGRRDSWCGHRQTAPKAIVSKVWTSDSRSLPLLPNGEKVPAGRMRGRHGTMPATTLPTNLNHHSSPTTGGKL